MLAYLLPGWRHTRTPLVAGALWLLIAWLVLGDRLLPDEEGGRAESLLYDLGTLVGGAAILAGLALLATLIGGMIPRLPTRWIVRRLPINRRGRWWQGPLCWFFGVMPDLEAARGDFDHWVVRRVSLAPDGLEWSQFTGKDCPPGLQAAARDLQESGSARVGGKVLTKADFAGEEDPTPWEWLRWGLAEASIRTEVDSELPLQLHVERESLFYEYDRVRAESELRAAIALPLAILIPFLMAESWLWAFALVIPIWLLSQAVQSYVEAEQQVLSAVRHGVIRSSTIAFVDSLRPDLERTEP
jgi:hypothetical protein